MDVAHVLADLVDEQHALDDVVDPLESDQWQRTTPSIGWTVADQIGHLAYFDTTAALAIQDPEGFTEHRDRLLGSFGDAKAVDDATLGEFRRLDASQQLERWRAARAELATAAATLNDGDRVEWYGPSMSATSFLTARLMEVWAHGQDVVDAVGATRPPSDRLRHIAQLGIITRGWSYIVRGEVPPEADVRVSLTAPSGETWSWGPDDADNSVGGTALDFCLVVTQRRHVDDTELDVRGAAAADWMHKAQAFAGGPSTGPQPRGRN